MHRRGHLEQALAKQEIATRCRRRITNAGLDALQIKTDLVLHRRFALQRKTRSGALRAVDHVPGKHDDGGKFEASVEPLLVWLGAAQPFAGAATDRCEIERACPRLLSRALETQHFPRLPAHGCEVAPPPP